MGKKSGLDNVAIWGEKLGIELNEEEAMDVLQEVKLKSHDLKRVLTEEEFMQIAEKVRSGS
jgi:isopropylmalate/homocitrate/citramalate synthase